MTANPAEMDQALESTILLLVLLALVLAVISMLQAGRPVDIGQIGSTMIVLLSKFILFCGFCFLFARYFGRPIIAWFLKLRPKPAGIVVVTGFSFIISGIAGILGFSLATGALFAGLAFSRDPSEHRINEGFEYIFLLFSPSFFVGLGLGVDLRFIDRGIAMVVLQQARYLGDWVVPPELFRGMIVVSLMTCLTVPLALQALFRRGPRPERL